MSTSDQYKKLENAYSFRLQRLLRTVFRSVGKFVKSVHQTGKQRFTIMLIPHSERKIFNFKISVFALFFLSLLLTGLLFSFVYFTTHFTGVNQLLSSKSQNLDSAEASLEAIRDQIYDLRKAATVFLTELEITGSTLGLKSDTQNEQSSSEGDLSSFFALQEQDEGLLRELGELKNLSDSMLSSVDMLKDIGKILESRRELMEDLPTLWPVPGRTRITNFFGFAEHPFDGTTYLHKGIDIAKTPGAPILAAANGTVIERKFDRNGLGNYIVIQHIAGFYTKYGHLDQVSVKEGDTVAQGQKIGTMGNTGLSTGHHLHFEIRLGSQVKNPLTYLRLTDSVNVVSTPY